MNTINTTSRRMTAIDLFSGAGGMSLGFESAGFDIIGAVEVDPIHALVHHINFPYTQTICNNISDVTEKDFENLLHRNNITNLDIVVGGPPCQGFSNIGKRQLDDPRNKLVFEYVRALKILSPNYFIFENVPGLASGDHKKFLYELINEFEGIGYKITLPFQILDAADYGVPQKRRRLILIGSKRSIVQYPKGTHYSLSEQNVLFNDGLSHVGARSALSSLEDIGIFVDSDSGVKVEKIKYAAHNEIFSFDRNYFMSNARILDTDKVYGHIGSRHASFSVERFANTPPGSTEPVSRFYRLHPDRPCNTLRAGTASDRGAHTAPRPIHYSQPRCISIREAARLHSFPDWFQFHRTIWHGFRQIGNAVAPLLARAIALEIIKSEGKSNISWPIRRLIINNSSLLVNDMSEASDYWGVSRNVIPPRKRMVG
ncbi:MAG: DNA cytosine methyltransferase [Magnetococcales bacterium]|nr:DNA cytosine methyltransferase [Magnetococcales bacterium]